MALQLIIDITEEDWGPQQLAMKFRNFMGMVPPLMRPGKDVGAKCNPYGRI